MSENPITPSNSGEENPNSPEQISDQSQAALEALAKSHDDLEQRLAAKEAQLSELQSQVASLQRQAGSGEPKTSTEEQKPTIDPSPTEAKLENPSNTTAIKQKSESVAASDTASDSQQENLTNGTVPRSVNDRTVSNDLLQATERRIDNTQAEIDLNKGWGEDVSKQETQLQGDKDFKDYLEGRDFKDDQDNVHDAETGRFKREEDANSKPEEQTEPYENPYRNLSMDELLNGWAEAEDAGDRTKSMDIQDVIQDKLVAVSGVTDEHKMNLIDTAYNEMLKRRKNQESEEQAPVATPETSQPEVVSETPAQEQAPVPASGESQSTEAEGPEKQGDSPEARTLVEVPKVDPGMYPDLYARMKNLAGGDAEKLKEEADRVAAEITANVQARVNNFLVENPDASPEQVKQFAMACYVDAQNNLQEDIISAIDGKGYENAAGEVVGRSALRRFGAWMDRNGDKIKKVMKVGGYAGLVVIGAGLVVGAIAPVIAIGAGTAIGAAKGAAVGLGMSRQGSKESYSKTVDASSEDFEKMFRDMDPADSASFARMSDYLMQNFNEAADKDHTQNVRKSRRAAVIGAVLGGIFGSISFQSTHEVTSSHTVQVHDKVELPKDAAPIQKGELSGQVIDRVLNQMGVEHKPFTMPDGSTNSSLIRDTLGSSYKDIWHKGTHSFAGAAALSDSAIRAVVTAVAKAAAGTHTETITQAVSNTFTNIPATIGGWITGGLLTGAATRQASDSVKNNELNR